ncbi:hypothetical protein AB0M54_03485 [Actinoplanes sp. NPDC051470]|uniref:DUF7455 domain-containing protein n=1 Tax=unclassified Actinoplanes TaxID=2626549 RepID=UPI00341326CB
MTTLVSTPEIVTVDELIERCDSCAAAARLEVTLPTGTLAFCGHHANKHGAELARLATVARVEKGFIWAGVAQ